MTKTRLLAIGLTVLCISFSLVAQDLPREIRLQALTERLRQLESENAQLSLTYSPAHPLRQRIQEQIAELRAEISSQSSPVLAAQPSEFIKPVSQNTVALAGFVQDRTLFFRGSQGTYSYRCNDCTFFVGANRVGGSADGTPGVMVHLKPDANEIEVRCAATECHVLVYQGSVAALKMNDSVVIPANSPAVIRFFEK
jgi:hypothetical protein